MGTGDNSPGAPGSFSSERPEDETPTFDAQGQVIAGRYRVLGWIGAGGMGSVYRVRDEELGEDVALKLIRRRLVTDASALERFRREARLARRVTHRNVVRMFDIGDHKGEKFLTMELVDGESLGARLARLGALSAEQAVVFGLAICEGLAAAHDAGVVHLDLKPDNVILDRDGRAVLTDFGVAVALGGRSSGGDAGQPLGTPMYMAPEQFEEATELDGRVDVYAFGAILYEMLTGRPAWAGATPVAVAMERHASSPPDPRATGADVPDQLAAIVVRCLAVSRDDRYASARAVGEALRSILDPQLVSVGEAAQAVASSIAEVASSLGRLGTDTDTDDSAES